MKKLLPLTALVLPAALSACGSPAPEPIQPKPVQTISGKAPAAAGSTLSLIASDGEALGNAVNVAADGSFTAQLPTPDAARLKTVTKALEGLPCVVKTPVTSSAPGALGLGVTSAKTGETTLLAAAGGSSGLLSRWVDLHVWIYSDQPTTLTGELDCAKATGGAIATLPVTVNISLLQGWTPVVAKINGSFGFGGLTGSGTASSDNDYRGEWLTTAELLKRVQP